MLPLTTLVGGFAEFWFGTLLWKFPRAELGIVLLRGVWTVEFRLLVPDLLVLLIWIGCAFLGCFGLVFYV